ncbi:MAG TPA: hypothetical protein VHM90_18480 [Phycisphaerae bacterium]|nr:hypothetical protein [Phycisphaerae bacterium]
MCQKPVKFLAALLLAFSYPAHAQTTSKNSFFGDLRFASPYQRNQWLVVTSEGLYLSSPDSLKEWSCVHAFADSTFPTFAGGDHDQIYWIDALTPDSPHRLIRFENKQITHVRDVPSNVGSFANAAVGCVADQGSILTTLNGGADWSAPFLVLPKDTSFLSPKDEVIEQVTWLSPREVLLRGSDRHIAYCTLDQTGVVSRQWMRLSPEFYYHFYPLDEQSFLAVGGTNCARFEKNGGTSIKIDTEKALGSHDDYVFADDAIFAWESGEVVCVPFAHCVAGNATRIRLDRRAQVLQSIPHLGTFLFLSDGRLCQLNFAAASQKEVPLEIDQRVMDQMLAARRNRTDGIHPSENEFTAMVAAIDDAGIEAENEVFEKARRLNLQATLTPRQYTLWLTAEFSARIPHPEKTK